LIVVADSSPFPVCETNQKIVTSAHDDLNIRYNRYSPDTYIPSKIAQALGTVDSKYSVLCADDDFIVPRAIEQCVQFLESNPDYEVVHGHSMRVCAGELMTDDGLLTFSPVEPGTEKSKLWSCDLSQGTIDNVDPSIRLHEHLFSYAATFYSVHRRLNLMRNMQFSANLTRDIWFGELLPSCLSTIQGKVKRLSILHQVRPYNPPDSARDWIDQISPDFPTLLISDDFSQRYAQFRNCLSQELATITAKPIAEAKNIVNRAFLAYLTHVILIPTSQGKNFQHGMTTFERTIRRARKATQILHVAANSAFFDHKLVTMIRSPRKFARMAYVEQAMSARGYIPVDRLLNVRSSFHADFFPIYEYLFAREGTKSELIPGNPTNSVL
jgi:glycosyltransferase domain-containing protein